MKYLFEIEDSAVSSLASVVLRAVEDRREYLTYGNPHKDYPDEWPEVAAGEAVNFRRVAAILCLMDQYGSAEACLSVAADLEASGLEYRNPEVGN